MLLSAAKAAWCSALDRNTSLTREPSMGRKKGSWRGMREGAARAGGESDAHDWRMHLRVVHDLKHTAGQGFPWQARLHHVKAMPPLPLTLKMMAAKDSMTGSVTTELTQPVTTARV